MNIKKLQKKVDKALLVLSDNDDKKEQERYINLQSVIEETQDYIEKCIYDETTTSELYEDLVKGIKEFKKDRFIFIIFLIILCGLLFIGVFYITYSHMYDYWHPHPGGHIKPPHRPPHSSKTTTSITEDVKTTVTESTSVTTTDKVEEDVQTGFVTLSFDNSSLIDLENLYPMDDKFGLTTKPTTWSLSSSLNNSSKDYILTYYIDFVDKVEDIALEDRLDISKLKYQLLIKKNESTIYDSGVQDMYDYPESEEGIRPIITGQTFSNDNILDFELRMWLASQTGNDQQGKKYRFQILVTYDYRFID